MVRMIESFLKIKDSTKETLMDLSSANLWIKEHISLLEVYIEVLNPVNNTVEALSRRADVLVNCLLSRKMVDTIKNKIGDPRDNNMLSLIF